MAIFAEDGFNEFVVEAQGVRVLAGAIGDNVWGIVPLSPHGHLAERELNYVDAGEAAKGAVEMVRRLLAEGAKP